MYYIFSSVQEVDKDKQKRDAEEMGDAMKSLENRTLDSKREMDIIAALDEMKSMKVWDNTCLAPSLSLSVSCSSMFNSEILFFFMLQLHAGMSVFVLILFYFAFCSLDMLM